MRDNMGLYRGKRVDNGEWLIGYPWVGNDHTYITPHNLGVRYDDANKLITAFALEVAPATVGQYTGLTDKNGKRIFEGDVVRRDCDATYNHSPSEVYWNEQFGKWSTRSGDIHTDGAEAWIAASHGEVISTIHDQEARP